MLNRYIGGGRKRDPTTGLRLSAAQPAGTVIHLCVVGGLWSFLRADGTDRAGFVWRPASRIRSLLIRGKQICLLCRELE